MANSMKRAWLAPLLALGLLVPAGSANAAAIEGPSIATFADPKGDVHYTDWFDPSEDDSSAADIKNVTLDYTKGRLTVTVRFYGMNSYGLAHIADGEIDFDTLDPDDKTNFNFAFYRNVYGVVGRGRGDGHGCDLHGVIDASHKMLRVWAPDPCLTKANGSVPSYVRAKVSVDAEENECPPGDCIDDWSDWLNSPGQKGIEPWTSEYVRRT